MTPKLPIVFTFFTSTRGHWGCKDLYKATLTHYDRQVPLVLFGTRLAHIKVGMAEQALGDEMEAELKARGFEVIKTVADWSRGTSHQHGILLDQRTVSRNVWFRTQPFMLLVEDDSPVVTSDQIDLTDLLVRSCDMLVGRHDLVSIRTLRAEDLSTSPRVDTHPTAVDPRWFYSPHFNLQPAILRTRDFYLGCNLIERNWDQVGHLQCELLWRLVFDQFGTSSLKHLVYHPDYVRTVHLGVENHASVKASLHL